MMHTKDRYSTAELTAAITEFFRDNGAGANPVWFGRLHLALNWWTLADSVF